MESSEHNTVPRLLRVSAQTYIRIQTFTRLNRKPRVKHMVYLRMRARAIVYGILDVGFCVDISGLVWDKVNPGILMALDAAFSTVQYLFAYSCSSVKIPWCLICRGPTQRKVGQMTAGKSILNIYRFEESTQHKSVPRPENFLRLHTDTHSPTNILSFKLLWNKNLIKSRRCKRWRDVDIKMIDKVAIFNCYCHWFFSWRSQKEWQKLYT